MGCLWHRYDTPCADVDDVDMQSSIARYICLRANSIWRSVSARYVRRANDGNEVVRGTMKSSLCSDEVRRSRMKSTIGGLGDMCAGRAIKSRQIDSIEKRTSGSSSRAFDIVCGLRLCLSQTPGMCSVTSFADSASSGLFLPNLFLRFST